MNVRPTATTTTATIARVTKGSAGAGAGTGTGQHRKENGVGGRENSHMHKLHTYARLSADIVRYVAATEGAGCERNKVRGGGCINIGASLGGGC